MQQQLIIRFPLDIANAIRNLSSYSSTPLEISVSSDKHDKKIQITFGTQTFQASLVDLPCIIETHKTFDHQSYFKTGDISQVFPFVLLFFLLLFSLLIVFGVR
jgi:transcription initiation factor TFIID subunit 7